jgi:hypothetical protein
MFMLHDPKKLAAVIVSAKVGSKPAEDEPESDETKMAEEDAGRALLAAVEAKDPVALFEAMEDCYELCQRQGVSKEEGEGSY